MSSPGFPLIVVYICIDEGEQKRNWERRKTRVKIKELKMYEHKKPGVWKGKSLKPNVQNLRSKKECKSLNTGGFCLGVQKPKSTCSALHPMYICSKYYLFQALCTVCLMLKGMACKDWLLLWKQDRSEQSENQAESAARCALSILRGCCYSVHCRFSAAV